MAEVGEIIYITFNSTNQNVDTKLVDPPAGETWYVEVAYAAAFADDVFANSNYSFDRRPVNSGNLQNLDQNASVASGDWNDDASGWIVDEVTPDTYVTDEIPLHFQAQDNDGLISEYDVLIKARGVK